MTRFDVVALLEEFALLLDLLNEDEFRAKAFANAARQLSNVTATLDELMVGNRLSMVRGIGSSMVNVVREIVDNGTFSDLETARARVPSGVLDLMKVEGLGPKKARALWRDAGIESIDQLEQAIESGSLNKLAGFGGKTLDKFRASIVYLRTIGGRKLRHVAKEAVDRLTEKVGGLPGVVSVHFCGSFRRNCETVGDLDCIVCATSDQLDNVRAQLSNLEDIAWEDVSGIIWSGRDISGMEIELSVCEPAELGTRLVLATGSKPHLEQLTSRAAIPVAATEGEVYRALGLSFVPPPLREESLMLRAVNEPPYPAALTRADIRGILHVHTTYSDGKHTLRQMAEAMMARGYEFLGIADHSKAAAYAGGLTIERLEQQWEEIDLLNSEFAPFKILKGTECDILPDGSMDFDDGTLKCFDFVVASIHSGFAMSREQATDRLCRALENPHVDILGHMTGRMLLKREGYPVDHERVLECAAKNGKAIELNCSPYRLDLDWRWFQRALELKIPIPLNPDSHTADGLDEIEFGLELAAKGPIPLDLCPSAWSHLEFLTWCQSHD